MPTRFSGLARSHTALGRWAEFHTRLIQSFRSSNFGLRVSTPLVFDAESFYCERGEKSRCREHLQHGGFTVRSSPSSHPRLGMDLTSRSKKPAVQHRINILANGEREPTIYLANSCCRAPPFLLLLHLATPAAPCPFLEPVASMTLNIHPLCNTFMPHR